jgi:hypothetical protein
MVGVFDTTVHETSTPEPSFETHRRRQELHHDHTRAMLVFACRGGAWCA